MMSKATSTDIKGVDDGWQPEPGWFLERTPGGDTRLVVSVPSADLPKVHQALVRALQGPLGFLYRQVVDRLDPKPQGAPSRDLLALELTPDRVCEALEHCQDLVYRDARCEVWVRGAMGEQLILDTDGLIYLYPDDPSFHAALAACGVAASNVETMTQRDYVKHWFHASNDAVEAELFARLSLTEMAPQRR